MDGSLPEMDNAVQRGNQLFFIADPDGLGSKLYKTEGTSANTVLLEGSSSNLVSMILGVLNNDVYYIAGDYFGGGSFGLYKTTGAVGAGQLVSEFNQAGDLIIAYPISSVMNNVLYFIGNDGNNGFELWRTDGTNAGTFMVKDIHQGVGSSIIYTNEKQYFAQLNGYLYFGAAESVNGAELWRTDGTEAGTTLVADIDTSAPAIPNQGSNPAYFCVYNNEIYFSAYRPVDGRELWKTDGTAQGTTLVKDIAAGDGLPTNMIVLNGTLYFTAYHPNETYTLYKSNGTSQGTSVVRAPSAGGPSNSSGIGYHIFQNKLFFSATNLNGDYGIWYSDGTSGGTTALVSSPSLFDSYPNNLFATTNYLYFTASLSGTSGVYRTSGLVNQTTKITAAAFQVDESQPLHLINNCLVVIGDDGSTGNELYSICGQVTDNLSIENHSMETITVYPNPAVTDAYLQLGDEVDRVSSIVLFDSKGVSYPVKYTVNNTSTIRVMDLDLVSPGVYYIRILLNNGERRQSKLIIE
jgi:ELWxxDGT repeat protein